MPQSSSVQIIKQLLLFSLACLASGQATVAATETRSAGPADHAEQELLHAETCYWFGLAEQGNLAAFDKGMAHLQRVEVLMSDSSSSDEAKSRFQTLRTDPDRAN